MVAWLCQDFFYELKKFFIRNWNAYFLCSKQTFISSECPFHTLGSGLDYFQVYIIIYFFYGYKGQ